MRVKRADTLEELAVRACSTLAVGTVSEGQELEYFKTGRKLQRGQSCLGDL